jgi:hypothetical protein
MVIFATSNSTELLSKPLLSRFSVLEIPEYTCSEFEGISTRIVNKLPQNTVIQIASSVWKAESRDIRDVLKIAKLCIDVIFRDIYRSHIFLPPRPMKNCNRQKLFTNYCKSHMPLIFGSVKDLLKEQENLFAQPQTITVKVTYTIQGFRNTVVTFDLSGKDIESIKKELPLKKKELDSNFNVDPYRSSISIDRDAYK